MDETRSHHTPGDPAAAPDTRQRRPANPPGLPVEPPTLFNDAKSSVKFLEAAILAVPSVCSPSAAFRDAIEPGVTGLLADDPHSWHAALTLLVDDPSARRRIGLAARAAALERWHPQLIAGRQLAPLLEHLGVGRQ